MSEQKIDKHEPSGEPESIGSQEGKFLTFSLGGEEYGIEIKYVTEIIGIQTITELPDTPDYVKGVINLRGKVVPVIDVRLRFNIEALDYHDRTCIIVVDMNRMVVGLIVDAVSEVIDIPSPQIEAPPKVTNRPANAYIKGFGKVGGEVKILLDSTKLLFDSDVESLSEAVNE